MEELSQELIRMALQEDLAGVGDLTSQYFIPEDDRSIGKIISRENAIVSGLSIAEEVFRKVDGELSFESVVSDGSQVQKGDVVCEIVGSTRSILTGERTALNFLQRLSGVATMAGEFVRLVSNTGATILDTRKTTPGWRALEKAAVVHGGATNHRMGLYDAVMVKDNHLVAIEEAGGLEEAIEQLRSDHGEVLIELEADRLDQVRRFIELASVDVILLDNMSNDQLREAVALRNSKGSKIRLEASGGVNRETVAAIADTGVDYISVGALTHSVRSIDLGLDLHQIHE